ncbi:type II toxin-antitoxin system PemK/MazF family toxin [Flaviflexus huanghaiensis]|uniref:type II toxin-antitoxin system PemK/MazF family toxin n=1 Tax=Flaviflexus huanghaiensis TaxID=1111473 RepID=UPI0030CA457D
MSFLNRAFGFAKSVATVPQTRQAVRDVWADNEADGDSALAARTLRKPVLPGPDDEAVEYSPALHGRASFSYDPSPDGDADPGEVVWTWVPYEDDPTQGKDRPVLVLARLGDAVVFAQMTSQDHVAPGVGASREDHLGRRWVDIGTGDWDREGRPSDVRIDRLLIAHKDSIRREGGRLDKTRFTHVARAISSIHRG